MVEVIFLIATVATIASLDALGGPWQVTVSALVATLVGVFAALEGERRLAASRDRADAKQALQMLRAELGENLEAARQISEQRLDLVAVVNALLKLRDEFWLAVARGGRVGLIRDLQLLEQIASAYDAVRNLRVLADLFFRGGELVRKPDNPGYTTGFDPLRKQEAARSVEQIKCALTAIDSWLSR